MRDEPSRFVYEALPARVIFGAGSLAQIGEEVTRLGARKALVLTTLEQHALGERVAALLGDRAAGVFPHAVMHVPIAVADAARAEAARVGADCAVAIGGGSTIGLGKAIALTSSLPILAAPTTYAGSEMTPIWGLTEDGEKRTGRDARVLPRTVIYDADLTLSLPSGLSATSGMNAIAHSVEALYAENANPIVSMMAEESISALAQALPAIVADPSDPAARERAQYGCWLAGMCLGAVGMALHHKLCHTLGGAFGLPHSELHTIVVAHAVAYNREAAPDAMARIARALGAADAATGLYDLGAKLGVRLKLSDIGMDAENIDFAADMAARNPYYNPRPVTREAIRDLLDDAFHGRRPVA